jgi:hypothetical protein
VARDRRGAEDLGLAGVTAAIVAMPNSQPIGVNGAWLRVATFGGILPPNIVVKRETLSVMLVRPSLLKSQRHCLFRTAMVTVSSVWNCQSSVGIAFDLLDIL